MGRPRHWCGVGQTIARPQRLAKFVLLADDSNDGLKETSRRRHVPATRGKSLPVDVDVTSRSSVRALAQYGVGGGLCDRI
jgi:hypothetical protein